MPRFTTRSLAVSFWSSLVSISQPYEVPSERTANGQDFGVYSGWFEHVLRYQRGDEALGALVAMTYMVCQFMRL